MLGRTLVQATPSFFETWTLPSSVPTQSRPGRRGDSLIEMIVQCVSAPVVSSVMPPVGLFFSGLLVERSGLTIIHVSPRLVDLKRWLPPK